MRLGLSSEAAPDASVEDLIRYARHRGLAALEFREGDAHGIDAGSSGLAGAAAAAEAVRAAGLTLTG